MERGFKGNKGQACWGSLIYMGSRLGCGMSYREPGAIMYARMWHAKKCRPGWPTRGTCGNRQNISPLHEYTPSVLEIRSLASVLDIAHRAKSFHTMVRTKLSPYSSSGENGKKVRHPVLLGQLTDLVSISSVQRYRPAFSKWPQNRIPLPLSRLKTKRRPVPNKDISKRLKLSLCALGRRMG